MSCWWNVVSLCINFNRRNTNMKRSNSLKETKCTACDAEAFARFEGVPYCKKHYMQMYHKGKITTRTIYDPNEYILHDDYAECITYDK